jgi:hypothetical protein
VAGEVKGALGCILVEANPGAGVVRRAIRAVPRLNRMFC